MPFFSRGRTLLPSPCDILYPATLSVVGYQKKKKSRVKSALFHGQKWKFCYFSPSQGEKKKKRKKVVARKAPPPPRSPKKTHHPGKKVVAVVPVFRNRTVPQFPDQIFSSKFSHVLVRRMIVYVPVYSFSNFQRCYFTLFMVYIIGSLDALSNRITPLSLPPIPNTITTPAPN